TSAAPIASLLIEKYLRDSIAGNERKAKVEQLANMNLIPKRMKDAMAKMDSIKHAKEMLELLKNTNKEAKDTIDTEEEQPDSLIKRSLPGKLNQLPKPIVPAKKDTTKKNLTQVAALLHSNDKKHLKKSNNNNV
ncbi:MAG: hypothetical protein ACOVNR_05115, partial [Chitinophagaceae bacterium]